MGVEERIEETKRQTQKDKQRGARHKWETQIYYYYYIFSFWEEKIK